MDIASEVLDTAFMGLKQPTQRPDNAARSAEIIPLARAARLLPKDRPLSPKWHMIMTMQLRGFTCEQIAKRLGCHSNTVSNISRTEKYQQALRRRTGDLDDDLLALKPLAIDALGEALRDNEVKTRLTAAKEFFAVTGTMAYGKHAPDSGNSVSPENLAKALVSAARAETHVNIHLGGGVLHEVLRDQGSAGVRAPDAEVGTGDLSAPAGLLDSPRGHQDSHNQSGTEDRQEPRRVETDGAGNGQAQPVNAQMELELVIVDPLPRARLPGGATLD